jgi:hypothetical protein
MMIGRLKLTDCAECPYFGVECLPDNDGNCLLDEDENSIYKDYDYRDESWALPPDLGD